MNASLYFSTFSHFKKKKKKKKVLQKQEPKPKELFDVNRGNLFLCQSPKNNALL